MILWPKSFKNCTADSLTLPKVSVSLLLVVVVLLLIPAVYTDIDGHMQKVTEGKEQIS